MTSTSPSDDPYIGQVIANRLQLKHLIGKGVMGPVYYTVDLVQIGNAYALKLLSPALASSDMRQRFARAAQISTKLGKKSLHVVQVKAYGIHEDKIPYYVMELLQGQTLKDLLKQESLSLNRFFKICRQICLGVQAAHQGVDINDKIYPVIHRNIKPANIMVITSPKGGELIKILDFGIAKLVGDNAGLTQTGSFMGTLGYCSPEQMEGRELDNRSDIYSLGLVMFEMLTNQRPWLVENNNSYGVWYKIHLSQPPRDFKTVNPSLKIPASLENLVMSCLAKQPGDRPQEISEVLKVLEDIVKQLNGTRKVQNSSESFQTSPSPGPSPTLGGIQNDSINTPVSKLNPAEQVEPVPPYLRRAQQYIDMKNWSKAVIELRAGLMLAPNSSDCHTLLGMVYLEQNQLNLASVHINKVLQLNPQDAKALHLKQTLDKLLENAPAKKRTTLPASTQPREK